MRQIRRAGRRTVLGAGCACLIAAGCSTPEQPSSAKPPAATPGPPTASGPELATEPAEVTTPAARVLTDASAIPVGGGRLIGDILVVQPLKGLFKAFDARCPHLGARVSPPQQGIITCTVHSSQFLDMDGSRLDGPASRGLKEIPIETDNGKIIIA